VSFVSRLLLGDGALSPPVRAALEAEGLVLIAENLPGSVRYNRFKAPGRRFHGKVTLERLAIAITEERCVVHCRSGRVELIDSPYTSPHWEMVELTTDGDDKLVIRVDYDRAEIPKVSGRITITAKTRRAVEIVDQLRARL
jgi:hypothetical protein